MAKEKAVFQKVARTKNMALFTVNGEDVWYDTSTAVKKFLQAAHHEGDTVFLVTEPGDKNDKMITRVTKSEDDDGGANEPPKQTSKENLNEPPLTTKFDLSLSAKQTACNSAARALVALQGQLDLNLMTKDGGIIDALVDKFLSKLK